MRLEYKNSEDVERKLKNAASTLFTTNEQTLIKVEIECGHFIFKFLLIEFIGVKLVNKIMQVSGT